MNESDLALLGRILHRFLTENEAGYDSPPYMALMPAHMTLDGRVAVVNEEERAAVLRALEETNAN